MSGRTTWNDEKIEAELRRLASEFGHFPSSSEMKDVGRNDLACAATKRRPLFEWAARIGMAREHSDSDTGWDGEDVLVEILRGRGWQAERTGGVKHPFDIIVEGVLRLDAKSARHAVYGNQSSGGACGGWFYRIGKVPQADMVVLVKLDTRDVYPIPWWNCPTSNMTLPAGGGGKYAPYLNNFALIGDFIDSYKRMREAVPMRLAPPVRAAG